MIRRFKLKFGATLAFTFINVVGALYAVVMGEMLHAGVHVALLPPSAWLLSRLAAKRSGSGAMNPLASGALTDRLSNLEQSIDAVAIEVDRIGEGQRQMTNFFAERDSARARGEGSAESIRTSRDRSSS